MLRHTHHHHRLLGGVFLLLGFALLIVPMLGLTMLPSTASAAPRYSLPTETPVLPTPEPSATPERPSVTPEQPTVTPEQPTTTPEQTEEHHRRSPSPTPTLTATPMPSPTPPVVISITDIGVEKTADRPEALPGDLVRFRIRLYTVTGADVATDVVVRDAVPTAFEVVDLASSKGDIVVNGQDVTAYPRTLSPGEEVIITVTARVRAGAVPGAVTNTAIITTSTSTDDSKNNTSSTSVVIRVPIVQKIAPPSLPDTGDPLESQQALLSILPWMLVGGLLLLQGGMLVWRGTPAMIRMPIPVASLTQRLGQMLGRWGLRMPGVRPAPPAAVSQGGADTTVPTAAGSGVAAGGSPAPGAATPGSDTAVIGPPLPEPGPSGPLPPIRPKDRRNL